jgi:hypothetical protein
MRRLLNEVVEENAHFAAGRLAVARNADGTLIVFHVGMGRHVLSTQQHSPGGGWTPWRWLTNAGLDITGQSLAVTQNDDGRLELFLVGTGDPSSVNGGDLLHCWQTTPGGDWSEWEFLLGQHSVLSPRNGNVIAAASDASGTSWLFVIKPDFGVYCSQRAAPGDPWSDWQRLTNDGLDILGTSLTVVKNPDGRLDLFLVGTGRDVLHAAQTPEGTWTPWHFLRGQNTSAAPHPGTSIAAALNTDGTLEVFALGSNLEVFRCRQAWPRGAWAEWRQMTNATRSIAGTSLAVGQNLDGRLELFLAGTGQELLQAWQDSPSGSWTEWVQCKERETTLEVAVGTNLSGTLEAFTLGTQQEVTHNWQSWPGGTWQPGWLLRESGDSVITNDVPQTEEMHERIASEYSLPGVGAEVLAVHAAVLPSGQVLYLGGTQYSGLQPGHPSYEAAGDSTRLWDPASHAVELEGSPTRGDAPSRLHDVFCCGHAFLPDGRLLVAGGYGGIFSRQGIVTNTGLRNTAIYDPSTRQWSTAGDMSRNPLQPATLNTGGSWYPTLLTLASGKVISMLGSPAVEDSRSCNTTVEIFDPATGAWTDQASDVPTPSNVDGPTYPRLHLLPDGRVFSTTPFIGAAGDQAPQCHTWDPRTRGWSAISDPPADCEFGDWTHLTTSVLLPLRAREGYKARVLSVGGAGPQLLDLSQPHPSWQNTGPRELANSPCRYNCNAVLLPTGQVLVLGGHSDHDSGDESTVVLPVELYDPGTDGWRVVTEARVPRQYHAVAVLLPDGRVWTAGSQARCEAGLHSRELRIEVFSPPYLFWGARPTISSAPSSITPRSGDAFTLVTPQASTVTSVTLVRRGSTTHGFDADQRCIELSIVGRSPTSLAVSMPPDNNIAPPGGYSLYVIHNRVPSIGRAITVNLAQHA